MHRITRTPLKLRGVATAALVAGSLIMAGSVLPPQTLAAAASKESTARADRTGREESRLDINKATVDQLQALPGVGPSLARKIVDYREKNGRFKRVEELMNVKGVGEKSFRKLKDLITVKS